MKKIIHTNLAPKAIGPYSQAVEAGGVLYLSGQLPIDPTTGTIPLTAEEQAAQCLENIGAILRQSGYDFENVVKSTVLLSDMNNFDAINVVYAKYYTHDMPARICYQVARLPKDALIEIETIAVK